MNNIKMLRIKMNLSQSDLAKLIDVSQQSIAKWETGENAPRADKLLKIAEILKCTVDDLFKDAG